jgi:uncharacterized protein (TIRG00374 family)
MTVLPEPAAAWIRRHKRIIAMCAQVVSLVMVTWFLVVPQLSGSMSSLHLLFHVGSPWIMLAFVTELASLASYALATRAMLPRDTRPPVQRVVGIELSAIALGHCLPDGGAAGTALSWRLLTTEGVPASQAAFSKVVQGLGAAVVLQAMLLASFIVGIPISGFTQWTVVPMVGAVTILAAAATAVYAVRSVGFRRRLGRVIRRLPRYGPRLAHMLAGVYRRHLVEQLRAVVGDRRTLLTAIACVGANWVFDGIALWASIRAYGSGVGIEAVAVVFGLQALAAWLPVTPSGLGVSEAVMIPALITFGAHHTAAVLGILTWRVISYWLPIPLGAAAFGLLRASRRPARPIAPASVVIPAQPSLLDEEPARALV